MLIPKPDRDLMKTKSSRPINLINCVGKLGEKVVADVLPEGDLLYGHQFWGVKGRLTLKAVFRALVKAQRCMASGVRWHRAFGMSREDSKTLLGGRL